MMKRKTFAAAMILIMLSLFGDAAFAAQEPAKVHQEVEITLSGSLPHPRETFTVIMEALDDKNPMPGGQVGGEYSIEILGEKRTGNLSTFPVITYTRPGIYKYEVWQEAGKHPRATYDDTVYTMTVTVLNKSDFSAFDVTVTFRDDEGGPKPDNDLFHNSYAAEPGTITPTGVEDDWPYYLAASAVLMAMSLFLMTKLRRREALETDADAVTMAGDDHDE